MRPKKPYKKKPKRIGRGSGSGHGKTSTRGSKGQMSRSGARRKPGFEGGQMTYIRRIPKRGFTPPFKKHFQLVNLDRLSRVSVLDITPDVLISKGLIRKIGDGLKILGRGEIKRAVTIHAHRFSQSAKAKIEKAGGKALLLELRASAKTTEKKGKSNSK